jgi:hypothetical protein
MQWCGPAAVCFDERGKVQKAAVHERGGSSMQRREFFPSI